MRGPEAASRPARAVAARPARPGPSGERPLRIAIWLAAAVASAGLSATVDLEPRPLWVWNLSASSPLGLYRVSSAGEPKPGSMVVAWLSPAMRRLAAERHYLPANVPLVKRVGAAGNDRVCAAGLRLLIETKREHIIEVPRDLGSPDVKRSDVDPRAVDPDRARRDEHHLEPDDGAGDRLSVNHRRGLCRCGGLTARRGLPADEDRRGQDAGADDTGLQPASAHHMHRALILAAIVLTLGWMPERHARPIVSDAPRRGSALVRVEFAQVHMGLPVRVVLHADSAGHARAAAVAAFARIAVLDRMMSDYRDDSELR